MSRPSAKGYAHASTSRDHVNGEKDHFYPTFPPATRALLQRETFEGGVWEPACGAGDMSKVLEEAGYEVISTDLVDRGYGQSGRDFLMEWQSCAPNIVTNPPFKLAEEFAMHALTLTTGKVALFLRLAFLARQRLGERDWIEGQIMLGHRPQSKSSDVYAPYQAGYLARAKQVTEEIIGEIESLCPNAFHRSNTGAVVLVRANK